MLGNIKEISLVYYKGTIRYAKCETPSPAFFTSFILPTYIESYTHPEMGLPNWTLNVILLNFTSTLPIFIEEVVLGRVHGANFHVADFQFYRSTSPPPSPDSFLRTMYPLSIVLSTFNLSDITSKFQTIPMFIFIVS
jgi:hypothetical protein